MKERILWLDNLKGFLILIVILGHTILFTDGTGDKNIISRYIISFWMYLFMFTSGFASYKSDIQLSSIKKRFCQLIIPFVAWSLFLSIFNDEHSFLNMILYPVNSVWFLFALFFISAINTIVCKFSSIFKLHEGIINLIVAALLPLHAKLVHEPTLFAISSIGHYYFSYLIGWYYRRNWSKISSQINWKSTMVFAILFCVMAYFNKGTFVPFGLPQSLHIGFDMVCGMISFGLFVPLSLFFFNRKIVIISMLWGGYARFVHPSYSNLYSLVSLFGKFDY